MNEVLPAISGATEEGAELSTTTGTWKYATAYTYQWEKCNPAGGECSNVGGASSGRIVEEGFAGHTLRVVVKGSNAGSEASATSNATAEITSGEKVPKNCFGPLSKHEACGGYPNWTNTGVPEGTELTKVASQLIITKAGETVEHKLLEGGVVIRANNVHLENNEITGAGCSGSGNGVNVIGESPGEKEVTGVVIKHNTVRGVSANCPNTLGVGIAVKIGSAGTVTISENKVYNVSRCFQSGGKWENNFCELNGTIWTDHYENFYEDGTNTTGEGGLVIKHNTLFNLHEQTAVIALFAKFAEVGPETIENNFMAGGGYPLYLNGAPSEGITVKGPVTIKGNRFARAVCPGEEETLGSPNTGVHACKGLKTELQESPGSAIEKWPASSGFFPLGGSFGLYYPTYTTPATASGNYWDDNLETATLP